ncbi:MAG: 5-formyltetrahydrofolate cyclo-ligase, partial [Gammaproteobacteria bacterium]
SRCIAAYLPLDGELDPQPLMHLASARGKRVCLPMIDPVRPGSMDLGYLDPGTRLLPNRFGILEPWRRSTVHAPLIHIDVVLVPLVAFDDAGNRLGMGAGYYDRLLQRRQHGQWQRPLLVGTAFEVQRVDRLPCQPWDVALDYVITEARSYRSPQRSLQ